MSLSISTQQRLIRRFVGGVLLFVFALPALPQKQSEWIVFAVNNDLVWAYSPKRITRPAAGTLRMWLKQSPPRDGVAAARAELIRKREENQLTTRGYDGWQYSLILF